MLVWLTSWPHCGSTLLRTFLRDVFGMECHSTYPEDSLEFLDGAAADGFGRNWGPELYERTMAQPRWVGLKTHEFPLDPNPAIWIVRDGRDACAGLARYWKMSVRDIILGLNPGANTFGTWTTHYHAWYPPGHENRIMVRFDDVLEKPKMVTEQVADLLSIKPIGQFINRFEEGHAKNPRLFSGTGKNHSNFEHNDWELFWRVNGVVMKRLGYIDEIPTLSRLPASQQQPRKTLMVKDAPTFCHKILSYPANEFDLCAKQKDEIAPQGTQ